MHYIMNMYLRAKRKLSKMNDKWPYEKIFILKRRKLNIHQFDGNMQIISIHFKLAAKHLRHEVRCLCHSTLSIHSNLKCLVNSFTQITQNHIRLQIQLQTETVYIYWSTYPSISISTDLKQKLVSPLSIKTLS